MRVTGGRHYPSDVLAAAAIAIAAVSIVVYKCRGDLPRWFFRFTRRLGGGLALVGGFVVFVALKGLFDEPELFPLAVVLVPVIAIPAAVAKRRALARLLRRCLRRGA
jgi:hypothetical protein